LRSESQAMTEMQKQTKFKVVEASLSTESEPPS